MIIHKAVENKGKEDSKCGNKGIKTYGKEAMV